MRYTAFLLLGFALILLQGEAWLVLGSLAAKGYRPSLIVPLLVFLGVGESNLGLAAATAFLLGYVLDVLGGAPIGLYSFAAVATVALSRLAGFRVTTQGIVARALLAGAFSVLSSVIVLVLLAIFGKSPWVPRALARLVLPQALATTLVAPLVFRAAERVHAWVSGVLDAPRGSDARRLASRVTAPKTEPLDGRLP